MYDEMQVAWMLGSGVLMVIMLVSYLVWGAGPVEREAAKLGCLYCDDHSCPDCVSRTAKLLKLRSLLIHTPMCNKRMSIGRVKCNCGAEVGA